MNGSSQILAKEIEKAKKSKLLSEQVNQEKLYPAYSSDQKAMDLYEAFRGTPALKTVKNELILKPELKRKAILEEQERRKRAQMRLYEKEDMVELSGTQKTPSQAMRGIKFQNTS